MPNELQGYLRPLWESDFDGDPNLRYQRAADIYDFYVACQPVTFKNEASSGARPICLQPLGWTRATAFGEIKATLFDGRDVHFVSQQKDMSPRARKIGFYDARLPTCTTSSAVLLQEHREQKGRAGSKVVPAECESSCILRHIRNALAHGHVYRMPGGLMLLRDFTPSKTMSAYVLLRPSALLELMVSLRRGPR